MTAIPGVRAPVAHEFTEHQTEATTKHAVAIGLGLSEEHVAPEHEFRKLLEHEPEGLPPDHAAQVVHALALVVMLCAAVVGVVWAAYAIDGWPAALLASFLVIVFLIIGGFPRWMAETLRAEDRKHAIEHLETEQVIRRDWAD